MAGGLVERRPQPPAELRQVRLENAWLRVDFLPQLGGRLRSAFDKAAGQELFRRRPPPAPGENLAFNTPEESPSVLPASSG